MSSAPHRDASTAAAASHGDARGRRHGPIRVLISDRRAQRAFAALGIDTIGDFLDTPREKLLKVRGFGAGTYARIRQQVEAFLAAPPDPVAALAQVLPERLLDLPLDEFGLDPEVASQLAQQGATRLVDLLRRVATGDPATSGGAATTTTKVRTALDRLLGRGLDEAPATAPGVLERLLAPLAGPHAAAVRRWLERPAAPAAELEQLLPEAAMAALRQGAPRLLERMRDETLRELRAFEGAVTSERLAAGTVLHRVARETGSGRAALRLGSLCFPTLFHVHGDVLTAVPAATFRMLRRRLRQATRPAALPLPLAELERQLAAVLDPIPHGLIVHLLEHRLGLSVRIDPEHGELVQRRAGTVADRLQAILAEQNRPLGSEDLLFFYRDRWHRGSRSRILDHLVVDSRFVELGRDLWGLRDRHLDELEMARAEAERMSRIVCREGGRHNVRAMADGGDLSERQTFLLIECLRKDPALRDLGRGDFCPRNRRTSAVLDRILRDFKRAMGEVPRARFLDNQPHGSRRLVATLLRENRLFVEPAPDRIDLLTNYPFNEKRLHELMRVVAERLEAGSGHAAVADLLPAVEAAGLGGSFLCEHLLLDLLRRHGRFELLPGGIVAREHLGLAAWIRQKAREAIRQAGAALSPAEVQAEVPELAAFAECLQALLDQDPMVQSPDGMHYQVV